MQRRTRQALGVLVALLAVAVAGCLGDAADPPAQAPDPGGGDPPSTGNATAPAGNETRPEPWNRSGTVRLGFGLGVGAEGVHPVLDGTDRDVEAGNCPEATLAVPNATDLARFEVAYDYADAGGAGGYDVVLHPPVGDPIWWDLESQFLAEQGWRYVDGVEDPTPGDWRIEVKLHGAAVEQHWSVNATLTGDAAEPPTGFAFETECG